MIALPRSLATIVVALVALTLVGAGPADAARHARAPKSHILTVPELVSACAAWAGNYEPGFGAFWDESIQQARLYRIPNGAGTFQFDRCMAAPRPGYPHGFPLNDVAALAPAPAPVPSRTPIAPTPPSTYIVDCMKDGASAALCDCTWRRFAQRYSQEDLAYFSRNNIDSPFTQIETECREALRAAF